MYKILILSMIICIINIYGADKSKIRVMHDTLFLQKTSLQEDYPNEVYDSFYRYNKAQNEIKYPRIKLLDDIWCWSKSDSKPVCYVEIILKGDTIKLTKQKLLSLDSLNRFEGNLFAFRRKFDDYLKEFFVETNDELERINIVSKVTVRATPSYSK
jgi:hypothetical protein